MFKVNNKNTRMVLTPLVSFWCHSFKHISQPVQVFLLLTLNRQLPARLDVENSKKIPYCSRFTLSLFFIT